MTPIEHNSSSTTATGLQGEPTRITARQHQRLTDVVLWTALVTPMTAEGQVDFANLDRLVADQVEAGNGILLLGSTGEGLALSSLEQRRIVSYVCDLAPATPLMVAVGGQQLDDQLQWLDFCNDLPIDAYLLASPLYAKPGPRGQAAWFGALLQRAQRPCMIYNVPSRSGVALDPSALASLTAEPNFWAIKEASGSIDDFAAFRHACPEVAIYSGDDGLLPYVAQGGAAGLVSVCANAWPEATQRYVRACLAGQAAAMVPLWPEAVATLFAVANPIPVKVLMHQQQVLGQPSLRLPLTQDELNDMTPLLAADQRITDWLCQQRSSAPQAGAGL